MKITVCGGSGFLGSHVADALTRAGHTVTVFDKTASPYLQPGQQMIQGDILDGAALAAAVRGADAVYHLAALADIAENNPQAIAEANVIGTINLLEACRVAGVRRFIFASSVYVYSDKGSFYRCSKQAAELFIEEYRQRYGLRYTILRYGSLYGPRA
ncbi:MAG TPA: NAD(P)-dependent oxidoreductase, partial [bacterium]|nr:NAD(P)-dependent oxidoreductase [bacterium]